jgi:hypothetical protein
MIFDLQFGLQEHIKATSLNGLCSTDVDICSWSTKQNNIIHEDENDKNIQINIGYSLTHSLMELSPS